MRILHGLDGLRQLPPGTVLSIGNFDGIHLGHRKILQIAHDLRSSSGGGGAGVAVATFEPHPLTVLRPELAPPRLTPLPLKQQLLEEAGVDFLIILPPTREVLDLSAEDFWRMLRDEVRPSHMVEGTLFNFGKDRRGNIDRLREWSAPSEVKLHVIDGVMAPLLDLQVVPVSSSLIRWLLAQGRVRDAAICLGREYLLRGEVIRGHQRGRTIGVPTANLRCDEQMIPADGVYAGRCAIQGRTYAAAVSIGAMPTFGVNQQPQVEAHLLGFDADLYGQTLQVELIDWIREQQKFDGIESLKLQIAQDLRHVVAKKEQDSARPIAIF